MTCLARSRPPGSTSPVPCPYDATDDGRCSFHAAVRSGRLLDYRSPHRNARGEHELVRIAGAPRPARETESGRFARWNALTSATTARLVNEWR